MASPRKNLGPLFAAIVGLVSLATPARAELGSLGATTIGFGASAGFQTDSRGCDTAGSSRTTPNGSCVMFAGGVDMSILWRGHIGGSLGVWSVSGQAASIPEGGSGAAFPDRVSVPLLIDFRPLSFSLPGSQNGYLSRLLYGVRLGIGPSLEFVRTASDSSWSWGQRVGEPAKSLVGMHLSIDAEVPLQSSPQGLSLRFSTRVLYVPIVVLNDGAVQSAPITSDAESPTDIATTFQGYAAHVQVYLGLVYYL